MPTSFVFPPSDRDIGWFDDYAAGVVNAEEGAVNELVTAPVGSELSPWDTTVFNIWLAFHRNDIASIEPEAEEGTDLHLIKETVIAVYNGVLALLGKTEGFLE